MRSRVVVVIAAAIVAPLAALATIVPAAPATAAPATTVAYPPGATATRYTGLAFDACAAPSSSAILAWEESPYRALGVYIGGEERTCGQPNLTSAWLSSLTRRGWRLLPIWLGRQAPCTFRPEPVVRISASLAPAQGAEAARNAVAAARALGMLPGSALYNDMEHYDVADTDCRTTVLRFLSGWTNELHRRGYLSGVYAHQNSGAFHLAQVYTSTAYARPDALWIARWDGSSALTGWPGIPDSRWAAHQRAKQYRGDHSETYGGVTINIDNDRVDAPVATASVAYTVTSDTPLNARTGPATSYPVVRSYDPGATLRVACQVTGMRVGTTAVWDLLVDGTYVSDLYVSTPSKTGYSRPLPRCANPQQVAAPETLSTRAGPGTSYPVVGSLTTGSLAWVICQAPGTTVGTTSVWDKLTDATWVSDYYVATPSTTTFSPPMPRC